LLSHPIAEADFQQTPAIVEIPASPRPLTVKVEPESLTETLVEEYNKPIREMILHADEAQERSFFQFQPNLWLQYYTRRGV